ncbi:MAG: hypothetical protein ISR65_06005 [Bacteriovoracaceae bacterium]|nr:hypothetical protein [Bacteriovoracaceae bacterium]
MVNNKKIDGLLIPALKEINKRKQVDLDKGPLDKSKPGEFDKLLSEKLGKKSGLPKLQVSGHAAKRLQERNIALDGSEYLKLQNAVDKLKNKGGKESLVVTKNAAYIIDVNNGKIVTAVDKNSITENIFTKIDSTVFVD